MTILIHLVGPQGCGKSTLAMLIVAGAAGKAAHLQEQDVLGMSNAQNLAQHQAMHLVCVEAQAPQCRHSDLQPGDAVMSIAGQGVRDAARPA